MDKSEKGRSLISRIEDIERRCLSLEKMHEISKRNNEFDVNYFNNKFDELKSCIITAISICGLKNQQIENMMDKIKEYFQSSTSNLLDLDLENIGKMTKNQ